MFSFIGGKDTDSLYASYRSTCFKSCCYNNRVVFQIQNDEILILIVIYTNLEQKMEVVFVIRAATLSRWVLPVDVDSIQIVGPTKALQSVQKHYSHQTKCLNIE